MHTGSGPKQISSNITSLEFFRDFYFSIFMPNQVMVQANVEQDTEMSDSQRIIAEVQVIILKLFKISEKTKLDLD